MRGVVHDPRLDAVVLLVYDVQPRNPGGNDGVARKDGMARTGGALWRRLVVEEGGGGGTDFVDMEGIEPVVGVDQVLALEVD